MWMILSRLQRRSRVWNLWLGVEAGTVMGLLLRRCTVMLSRLYVGLRQDAKRAIIS